MKNKSCFWRSLLPDRWFSRRKVVKTREMVSAGVMRVDFKYLHERRKRMTALAKGLGMEMDDMINMMKKRVYEQSQQSNSNIKISGKK